MDHMVRLVETSPFRISVKSEAKSRVQMLPIEKLLFQPNSNSDPGLLEINKR